MQRTVQMRMQLPVLPANGTRRDDAQLTPPERQRRTTQHLAVPFYNHPCIECRMQAADVLAQLLVETPVHRLTRNFAAFTPGNAIKPFAVVRKRRRTPGNTPPLARAV